MFSPATRPPKHNTPALHAVELPSYIRYSTRTLLTVLLICVVAMSTLPWQQTSTATGRVLAYSPQDRDQFIEAPIKGRIMEWNVREGERVKKGQVLAKIADNDPEYVARLQEQTDALEKKQVALTSSAEELEKQVASMRTQRTLELKAMDAKIKMATFEIDAAKQMLKAAEGLAEAAKLDLARKKTMEKQGLVSRRDFELSRAKATKAKAKVLESKAKLSEKRSKVLSLKSERKGKALGFDAKILESNAKVLDKRAKQAQATSSLSKARVSLARQRQQELVAPRDGVILSINAREGSEFVKAGDKLAVLIPHTHSRAVELWIRGMDVPLVWKGRKVRLQFEGWPAVQFSGWPSVAVGTFGGVVDFVDARANSEGKFRVLVLPDKDDESWPNAHILRQGARANGWILMNEVPLWYEFWRQLNGFPPTVEKGTLYDTSTSGKKSGGK